MSWDNNNLACILIFPPWQRRGFGKILMGISYELSKRDGRIGGPEKPLSELGRKGYTRFWEATIARFILGLQGTYSLTVGEIAKNCWVLPEDVIVSLKDMGLLEDRPDMSDGSVIVSRSKVREWVSANRVDLNPSVTEDGFVDEWQPQDAKDGGA
jgi:hypothetical protein